VCKACDVNDRSHGGLVAKPGTTPTARVPQGALGREFVKVVTFGRMEAVSLIHSAIYLALLISAFALGGPQPWTFIFGLSHGLIWIAMSIAAVAAVWFGVINLRLAVAIALLGCIAPFFGSAEFIRQNRSRKAVEGTDR
jgi:hypothetical protein